MFFGAADRIGTQIRRNTDARVVVLRLSHLRIVDATGAHALAELVADLELAGVTVLVKGVQPQHLQLLTKVGVLDELRHENHLFEELAPAIAHARAHVARGSVDIETDVDSGAVATVTRAGYDPAM